MLLSPHCDTIIILASLAARRDSIIELNVTTSPTSGKFCLVIMIILHTLIAKIQDH